MVTESLQYLPSQLRSWDGSPSSLGLRGGCGPGRSRPVGAEAGRQAARADTSAGAVQGGGRQVKGWFCVR